MFLEWCFGGLVFLNQYFGIICFFEDKMLKERYIICCFFSRKDGFLGFMAELSLLLLGFCFCPVPSLFAAEQVRFG